MRRVSVLVRVLVVVLAIVQAMAPAAASLADARLLTSDAALAGVPHAEDHGSSSCPRSHTPDCALCQYVSAPFLPGAAPAELVQPRRAIALPHGPVEFQRAAAALWQPPGRAPPTALAA